MLSVEDLKKLSRNENKGNFNHRCTGTPLIVVGQPSYSLANKTRVWFHSFNSFRSKAGVQKVSFERGFGKIGGADCWDDFTPEGQEWIKENYDPEWCGLIIATEHDVFGVNASFLRLA